MSNDFVFNELLSQTLATYYENAGYWDANDDGTVSVNVKKLVKFIKAGKQALLIWAKNQGSGSGKSGSGGYFLEFDIQSVQRDIATAEKALQDHVEVKKNTLKGLPTLVITQQYSAPWAPGY